MWSSRNRQGFTLIEILVVISIIMILIGILLPILTKSKEAGHLAECTSNLRQLGIAMQSYQTGHKMNYTPGILNGASGANISEYLWAGKAGQGALSAIDSDVRHLNTYIGGPFAIGEQVELAHCPMDARVYEVHKGSSYASNHRQGFKSLVLGDGISPINAGKVKKPERFVLGAEVGAIHSAYNDNSYSGNYEIKWHWGDQNRYNLLFADIHVDSKTMTWGVTQMVDLFDFEYE